jgi:hypothetical protein
MTTHTRHKRRNQSSLASIHSDTQAAQEQWSITDEYINKQIIIHKYNTHYILETLIIRYWHFTDKSAYSGDCKNKAKWNQIGTAVSPKQEL